MTLAAVPEPGPSGDDLLPPTPGYSEAKRRVLLAAVRLYGERGYHGVSVRDIAAELGLKPMALYTHAASKQDLLFDIVQLGFETHRVALGEALLEAGSDPVEQIRAIVAAHVRMHLRYAALSRVTNRENQQLDERFDAQLVLLRRESVRSFAEVVARGQRLGVFVGVNPVLILHGVADMGVRAPEWWTPDSGIEPEEVVRVFTDFAVNILTGGTHAARN